MKAEKLVSHQLKQAHARASSMHHLQQASRGSNMVYHHSIKQSSQGQLSHGVSSLGLRGVPHSFSSSSQLQSAVAAAALVSRPGVTMAYVNPSLTGHKTSASVDARQREYLLDMIPSRSSLSQTANTWK
ncbi:transcriptional repressor p66 alpha-like isoform X1 [Notothenia coriiceps]|uniref:Transcriptional repressor p66 alpha-like isoform X1 n=1 Tax=Notothenia coriiceps TaxID=8208 RepID=A0A6I9NYJ0_9TELE|nr:PREDICTED: transcriptional repressor p66 alpha-like isoform X1 [Notothenia coriiceps]